MPQSAFDSALPSDVTGWNRLSRPIWLFDPVSCRGLFANGPAMELWGASSLDELLSRDFSKLSPAVRTRTERLARATAHGRTVTERWTFYPNGEPRTVQAIISAFRMDDGRDVLLFEAAPIDVEEDERRAVEALRHTSSLITLFDGMRRPLFCNPAAFAAYGDEALNFTARFADPDEGRDAWDAVVGGEVLAEFRRVRTAMGERWHHLDARRVTDPVSGAEGILLSERDVTAQVEAERALASAKERAEVAEAKERFLANMSHELRTPLNSILGFSSVMAASALSATQAEHLAHITAGGERLLEMINDMITLSELENGEVSLEEAPFEPASLIETLGQRFARAAREKGLTLTMKVDPDAPAELLGDVARLKVVIGHYLANALKFTRSGEVALSLDVLDRSAGTASVEISVSDTGPGLDDATRSRLFQRFTPGDDSRQKATAGAGLGLAIVQETMRLMNGEAGVESEPGHGASFWIRLPLGIPEAAEAAIDEPEDEDAGGALNILYADDHAANRTLVQALLASQGHACDLVCDGAEAVEAARAGAYDLILMDIQMPVMDGVEATRAIRALGGPAAGVPIVALTANTLSEQRQSYAAAGMDDCIAKPVVALDLLTRVAAWGEQSLKARRSAA